MQFSQAEVFQKQSFLRAYRERRKQGSVCCSLRTEFLLTRSRKQRQNKTSSIAFESLEDFQKREVHLGLSHLSSVCFACPHRVLYLRSLMGSMFFVRQAAGWARVRLPVAFTQCCRTMSFQYLVPPPAPLLQPLSVPEKLLLGPGPSNCPPRVLSAGGRQLIGHVHKEMVQVRATDLTAPESIQRALHQPPLTAFPIRSLPALKH